MAAVAAVTFSGKLACDFSLEFKRECYTNKFAVHSRTCTECTPTILVHTRLRHFRDKSHAKSAAVDVTLSKNVSRTGFLPGVQLACFASSHTPYTPPTVTVTVLYRLRQPAPNAVGADLGHTTDTHGGLMSRHATTHEATDLGSPLVCTPPPAAARRSGDPRV